MVESYVLYCAREHVVLALRYRVVAESPRLLVGADARTPIMLINEPTCLNSNCAVFIVHNKLWITMRHRLSIGPFDFLVPRPWNARLLLTLLQGIKRRGQPTFAPWVQIDY